MSESEAHDEATPSGDVTAANDKTVGATPDEGAEINPAIEARIEQIVMERYTGPFPHPEHLERYAALYARAPEVIFETFEAQSSHRREIETAYMEGSERRANRGQWLAWSLVVLAIAAGCIAIVMGQAGAGATMVTAAFVGGVVLYIAGGNVRTQPAARQVQRNSRDKASAATGTISQQQ